MSRAATLSGAAVLCLGLGIGATTAVYSAVHTALLDALPFSEPDRLVSVFRTTPQFDSGPFAPGNYLDLRKDVRLVDGLAAVSTGVTLLRGLDEPLRVSNNHASGNLFRILGVRPRHGRLLQPADEDPAQPMVAVLSWALWQDRFGADPAAVGERIALAGVPHEIVGVLPPEFVLPHGNQRLRADVWAPLRFSPQQAIQRRSNYLRLIGRLAPGVTVEEASAELRGVMSAIVEANPVLRGEQLRVAPLHGESVEAVRGPLLLLLGSVGLVLLIAVANVAALLLARGVGRREELAVRSVLGAGRSALIRPILLETLILTAVGALLGLGLAWLGVRTIGSLVPPDLAQLRGLEIELPVIAFSLGVSVLAAAACALAPAWQAADADPQEALRAGGRGGTGGRHHRWLRGLGAAEVGFSLVLLLGAGLVMRGFQDLVSRDPGFDPDGLLTVGVSLDPERYPDGVIETFLDPVSERIRAIPGVEEAGAINLVPYERWGNNFNIRYEGREVTDVTRLPLVEHRVITPGAFRAIGQPLERGRLLSRNDGPNDPRVAVANRALVERDFPGEDPIGKRFHVSDTTFATIVGVVRDIKNVGPEREPAPEVYSSYRQASRGSTYLPLVVRTEGDPASFASAVRAAIREVDPTAAMSSAETMAQTMSRSVARSRFYLALFGVFASVAMALAVAGLYGVMAYTVVQRTRELGIRAALGSTPMRTVSLLIKQGLTPLAIGVAGGLLGGFALTRLLGTLLFGVSPLDPITWVVIPLVLLLVALLAIAVPARQATRIAPVIAMRED